MKTKPLHSKEKSKLSSWRLMRLHRLHAFYRRLMYRRSGIAMLAVLLTLIMTGPYACIKIDMIESKDKAEQKEKQKMESDKRRDRKALSALNRIMRSDQERERHFLTIL